MMFKLPVTARRASAAFQGVAMATVLVSTACASASPPDAPDQVAPRPEAFGGGGAEGDRGGLGAFISPMGEPFRSRRGEPYPVVMWFAQADTDHDGQLTEAEFVADADRFFDRLDTNHDGMIDGFEIADYERDIAPEILPRIRGLRAGEGMDDSLAFGDREGQPKPRGRGGRGGRGGGGEGGGQRPGPEVAGDLARQGAGLFGLFSDPEPVASAAVELNGRITRAQWRDAAHRRFQRLLQPGATTLTLKDLPKTPVQILLERRRAAAAHRPPTPGQDDDHPPGDHPR